MNMYQHVAPVEIGQAYELSWPLNAVWLLARDDDAARAAV
jgi:hypothetical protein